MGGLHEIDQRGSYYTSPRDDKHEQSLGRYVTSYLKSSSESIKPYQLKIGPCMTSPPSHLWFQPISGVRQSIAAAHSRSDASPKFKAVF